MGKLESVERPKTTTTFGGLMVYQTGRLSVVGFGGQDVPDDQNLAAYREAIVKLIETHSCEELAFDLTGVRLIPSGLLGVMNSVRTRGVKVSVYNPSKDVREVFGITKFDQLFEIREVKV